MDEGRRRRMNGTCEGKPLLKKEAGEGVVVVVAVEKSEGWWLFQS